MADKESTLAIVIRTVDKATAGLRAINGHIKSLGVLAAPVQLIGERLAALGKEAGLPQLAQGIAGVGGAVKDLLGKLLVVGGAVGGALALAVHGVLGLVDEFDTLGDTAERLGTSADFLAAIRYAAERAGAPIEGVDAALQSLVTNMGAAKAGTGRMLKFLNQISPTLAKQVTAANSLEEALGLLADASAKLPDAARRSKLAQATLGDAALAPLLARGSQGVQELLTKFHALAGSQGEAAEAAGAVDDALKDLHASTAGVKAALITGLAPALKIIVDRMAAWLSGHRADIARWAKDIGERLPGAVDDAVKAVRGAVRWVASLVDGIGGLKNVAIAVGAVMAGPLLASFAKLGAVLLSTPFGWVLVSLAAISAAVISLVSEIDKLNDALDTSHEKQLEDAATLPPDEYRAKYKDQKLPANLSDAERAYFESLGDTPRDVVRTPPARPPARLRAFGGPLTEAAAAAAIAPPAPPAEARIKVDFANVPRGTRVTPDPRNTVDVDLTVGHQMFGAGIGG